MAPHAQVILWADAHFHKLTAPSRADKLPQKTPGSGNGLHLDVPDPDLVAIPRVTQA